jgi:transposase
MRDRALLAAASRILARDRWSVFLVRPETIMGWHRRLAAHKWTRPRRRPGRPALEPEVRRLILRMAKENPRWGYMRIKGELQKLGIRVSATAIATLLRSHGIGPAPRRGPTRSQFLKAQASGIIACDFLTVETAFLKTLYVLFFIEIGSRRVRVSVSTSSPDSVFVTQQARSLAMCLSDEGASTKFLIRDRDAKFSRSFDDVLASEGVRVIRTPIRAPNANAFAERWVETVRADCLDWLLILPPAPGPGSADLRGALQPEATASRTAALGSRECRAGRPATRSPRWTHPRVRESGVIEFLHPAGLAHARRAPRNPATRSPAPRPHAQ